MSKNRILIVTAISVISLSVTHANQDRPSRNNPAAAAAKVHSESKATAALHIQPITEQTTTSSATKLKGQKVLGADDAALGKIEDFVVDAESGKIAYAVVSSGGALGIGEKLRLVQHSSLQLSPDGESFAAQLDRPSFEALPVVSRDDLKSNAAVPTNRQTRAANDNDVAPTDPDAATPPVTVTASASTEGTSRATTNGAPDSATTHLVLASQLRDKDVRGGDATVGKVQDLTLDLKHGLAAAVIALDSDFAGTDAKATVPLSHLQLRSGEIDQIATTLTRADFAQALDVPLPTGAVSVAAQPGAASPSAAEKLAARDTATSLALEQPGTTDDPSTSAAASDEPAANDNTTSTVVAGSNSPTTLATHETLSPTGRGDAGPKAGITAAATAIRQAIRGDAEAGAQTIDVEAADGKLILRGAVETEADKRRIEAIARVAAQGVELENRVQVNQN